jgi:DNA-binding response OmpR family regulator
VLPRRQNDGIRNGETMRGNGSGPQTHGPRESKRRALVCACDGEFESVVCRTLREEGYEVVACPDRETVLTLAFDDPPDVILYTLAPRSPVDRGVLQLLRRALPRTPLILIAAEGSLEVQRVVQEFRPVYYAVAPLERAELVDAVSAAIAQRDRLTLGSAG